MLENRMVDDTQWTWQNAHDPVEEKEIEEGYMEMGTNVFVSKEDAYDYALERCLNGSEQDQKEFKEMLVEWFFSGNWVEVK